MCTTGVLRKYSTHVYYVHIVHMCTTGVLCIYSTHAYYICTCAHVCICTNVHACICTYRDCSAIPGN